MSNSKLVSYSLPVVYFSATLYFKSSHLIHPETPVWPTLRFETPALTWCLSVFTLLAGVDQQEV